jgi:hypothetical protein
MTSCATRDHATRQGVGTPGPVPGSQEHGPDIRHIGFDRRQFSYTLHIPERRTGLDRRSGFDRRCGRDRRVFSDPRGAAARKAGHPGDDPRRTRERRSGFDRRCGTERRVGFRVWN